MAICSNAPSHVLNFVQKIKLSSNKFVRSARLSITTLQRSSSSSSSSFLSLPRRLALDSTRPNPRTFATSASSIHKPMEVEVKLRLPTREAYLQVADLIESGLKATYAQENYFFDGPNKELSSERAVLRLRFYNKDEKATLTLKGKAVLEDGIGRATEIEEAIDPIQSRPFLDQPDKLATADAPLMQTVRRTYNVSSLVSLGGFRNTRKVHEWEGFVLELDETNYEFGTTWEIEVETSEPEALRDKLEAFLKQHGIPYSYSKSTKFANFRNKRID